MNATEELLTIQQVSQQCDVPKSTLRFWEKKFNDLFSPVRSRGGQRRYSSEHVAMVELIKGLREEGLSLSAVEEAIRRKITEKEIPLCTARIELLADEVARIVKQMICRELLKKQRLERMRQWELSDLKFFR